MKLSKEIIIEIGKALSQYKHVAMYHTPQECNREYKFGYFEIGIENDYEPEWIEQDLLPVCEKYDLDYDWSSDLDVNLNAYWDTPCE